MSNFTKMVKKCRQKGWRHLFFGAAKSVAACGGMLAAKVEKPMKSTTYTAQALAATLAPCWRDHAAKPPTLLRVAATGGILAGGIE